MTDRRRRRWRPKVVPRAAADFVRQLKKLPVILYSNSLHFCCLPEIYVLGSLKDSNILLCKPKKKCFQCETEMPYPYFLTLGGAPRSKLIKLLFPSRKLTYQMAPFDFWHYQVQLNDITLWQFNFEKLVWIHCAVRREDFR